MATYVLVGGAWIGGWVWQRVAAELRADGHMVYPATLTGLGERVHLARPEVARETHLLDAIKLIEFEDLTEVALVGHSYAGAVLAGVADRIGDRLAHLVYVDSAPLDNGESAFDFARQFGDQEHLRRLVEEQGDGWRLPPPPFAELPMSPTLAGLNNADRRLLSAKSVPEPLHLHATAPAQRRGRGELPAGDRRLQRLSIDRGDRSSAVPDVSHAEVAHRAPGNRPLADALGPAGTCGRAEPDRRHEVRNYELRAWGHDTPFVPQSASSRGSGASAPEARSSSLAYAAATIHSGVCSSAMGTGSSMAYA